ncbi:Asp23/Gls24 family envelope stress response protein [Arthrobacter cheniae]|uniref:Asp23/Gls24 family envelope stress response protein n=1 Tax=Arthrobacter cheniae TaxID=1258888 RepID=A0A3A5M7B7_9MICC|nr:Asp23/Gls24 family envelope stress response protein [Arthrobacter cheniae]RJT75121.1 Asp23/Gls24 family envelope stress response protein [Arthrobacter cheniae]
MAEDQSTAARRAVVIPATGEEQKRQAEQSREAEQSQPVGPLQTRQGNTTIAETVVQKIAGIATREVPGVYAMGSASRRAFSSISERIPGSQTNVSGGVSVEKGERQAAIDLSIIVEHGASIVEVSQMIRRNVISSVEEATGLEVLEVNINVTDVHLPEDDDKDTTESSRTELQ